MKPIQQLLRKPLRLIAILLLLSLTCTFFTISFCVMVTAYDTAQTIEKGFTTVAYPTTRTELKEYRTEDGFTFTGEASVITAEMEEMIDQLPQLTSAAQGIYHQKYISAYSAQLKTWTNASGDAQYQWNQNDPYNGAVFLVRLTEIAPSQTDESTGSISVELFSDVLEALALHPDYSLRNKLHIHVTFASQEEMDGADLKVGGTYLVCTDGYIDRDLEQKTRLATALHCSVEDIDWENLVDTEAGTSYVTDDREIGPLGDMDRIVDTGFAVVQNKGAGYLEGYHFPQIDGTVSTLTAEELCDNPTITPVSADVSTFLSSEAGRSWMEMIRQCQIQYSSVPVMGTDLLESVYPFLNNDCYIVQGRTFDETDYAGNRVCILPETVALSSGLGIGDSIDLDFYWGADPYGELTEDTGPSAQHYNERVGFSGETSAYTIVGIYRQMNAWDTGAYSINPNTVFVPNQTLPTESYTSNKGIFYGILLKNGGTEEVRAVLTENGFPDDILLYFDGGFSQIEEPLENFRSGARIPFWIALGVYIAVGIAYFVFVVEKQRHGIGLMLSLGAGKRRARRFWWCIAMAPVGLAVGAGTICGSLLVNRVLEDLLRSSFEEVAIPSGGYLSGISPWVVVISALLQVSVYAVAIFLRAERNVGKKPLALMENRK